MKAFGIIIIVITSVVTILWLMFKDSEKLPQFIKDWNYKQFLGGIALGILFIFLNMSIFYAEPGMQYFVVTPTGHKYAIMNEGYKVVMPFSKIQEWQKYIDVKVVSKDLPEEALEEIEGKMKPIGIRFIDQVTAWGYVSTRFELPHNEEDFIELAIKFRNMNNLVNNTLIPTVKEQMINTGYMFAAQDYISGDAQSFRQTFEEQLKYGAYAVKKIEIKDTLWEPIQNNNQRYLKEIKTKYKVEKVYVNGKPKRIPHEITQNHIVVSQVIVDKVNLEQTFKKRLEAQRDESAKRQLEQQKIETAKASQERIIAEGERDKAAERVKQEKEQVKALIAIETEKKQEATKRDLARIALETEKLKAEAVKVKADAEAYKNKKMVNAGLTPQERAEWDFKTAVGVAEALAGPDGIKFPETYVSGGNSGNSKNDMMMLLLMEMMHKNNKK